MNTDTQIAKRIREAVTELNAAVAQAHSAGLYVKAHVETLREMGERYGCPIVDVWAERRERVI